MLLTLLVFLQPFAVYTNAMLLTILQSAIICSSCWFLWKYLRQIVVKSPLDNIPGPPSDSFFYGEHPPNPHLIYPCLTYIAGHLGRLLDRNGWAFLRHLTDSYNGVAKLHGPLGVSFLSQSSIVSLTWRGPLAA